MLFDKEHYGKLISPELSQYLRDWIDGYDVAAASTSQKVSASTIRGVVYRKNNVTKDNSEAIVALMKTAIVNCTNKIEYAKKVKKKLEESI